MTRQNIVDLPLVREGSLPLPEDEAALVGGMLEGYYARKKGARRKKAHYVRNEIKVVCEFIRFVGKVPWDWTEDDFDKWCLTLSIPYPPRAKALGENSQRKYQGALRRFLEYLTNNVGFQTQVQNLYGKRIYHICPKDACVVHTKEEEEEKPRRVFTFNEIETFMSSASRAIREAVRAGAKNVRVLQRDRAVWAAMYGFGLRVSEAKGIDVGFFRPDPAHPEYGDYGMLRIKGKGGKWRNVLAAHPLVPGILQWYAEEVRPFLIKKDKDVAAFFLSERGGRMSVSAFEQRFVSALVSASMDGEGFVTHSLRRGIATHLWLKGVDIEAIRDFLGHVFLTTTQIYIGIPKGFSGQEINECLEEDNRELLGRIENAIEGENDDLDRDPRD